MTKKPETRAESGFAILATFGRTAPSAPGGVAAEAGSVHSGNAPSALPSGSAKKGPARAVVRLERKQRGGKEVTIVEKLALPPAELARWCRELKQALGCGGVVEGDAIVLQGDLRQRLPAVLTARGVGKVTVGS